MAFQSIFPQLIIDIISQLVFDSLYSNVKIELLEKAHTKERRAQERLRQYARTNNLLRMLRGQSYIPIFDP